MIFIFLMIRRCIMRIDFWVKTKIILQHPSL